MSAGMVLSVEFKHAHDTRNPTTPDPQGDWLAEEVLTAVDRIVAMLADDAFRTGGAVPYVSLLKLAEKFGLGPDEVLAARSVLVSDGFEIEGDPNGEERPPLVDDAETVEEPSSAAIDAVANLLRDAGKIALLRPEEEVALSRRVKAGEGAEELLELGRADPAGRLARMREDGRKAREQFVNANIRLVMFVAKHYAKMGATMGLDDLVQEGSIGLMRAVHKFDHARGFKFSTYATWWIRQSITRAMADKKALIRVPVHMQELARKVKKARRRLAREKGGVPPSARELSEFVQLPAGKVQFLLDIDRSPVSLDAPASKDATEPLGATIRCTTIPSPEDVLFGAERRRELNRVVAGLKPNERQVLEMRFGHEMTLQDVGDIFEVTRERIRQIEAKALNRLRHPSRSRELEELLEYELDGDEDEKSANQDDVEATVA